MFTPKKCTNRYQPDEHAAESGRLLTELLPSNCADNSALALNKIQQKARNINSTAYIGATADVTEVLMAALPHHYAEDMASCLDEALNQLSSGNALEVKIGTSGLTVVAIFPGYLAIICPPANGEGPQ